MTTLGDSETVDSASFLARKATLLHPYDGSLCVSDDRIWGWAELKSSFLSQALLMNTEIQEHLLVFITKIVKSFYGTNEALFMSDFDRYMSMLDTPEAQQYRPLNHYPTAQVQAYVGNVPAGLQDVFILYNFMKFVGWTSKFSKANIGMCDPNECNCPSILEFLTISVFMQPVFNFFGMIRGNRSDRVYSNPEDYKKAVWDQIGMTYIVHPVLKRTLKQFPDAPIIPWIHPGNAQCEMPYWGKWGENIRKAREGNTVWGSLMCGISGSTQYAYFACLMSVGRNPTPDPKREVTNLFTLALTILHGGHNVREICYAIILTTIMLRIFLKHITIELRVLFGNTDSFQDNVDRFSEANLLELEFGPILSSIIAKIKNSSHLHCNATYTVGKDIYTAQLVKQLIKACGNWQPIVEAIYQDTINVNITGISKEDLDNYNPAILAQNEDGNMYTQYENDAVKYLADIPNDTFPVGGDNTSKAFNINAQILLALENNRYQNDNWEDSANIIVTALVKSYTVGPKILEIIDKLMKERLEQCKRPDLVGTIPFAFPGK